MKTCVHLAPHILMYAQNTESIDAAIHYILDYSTIGQLLYSFPSLHNIRLFRSPSNRLSMMRLQGASNLINLLLHLECWVGPIFCVFLWRPSGRYSVAAFRIRMFHSRECRCESSGLILFEPFMDFFSLLFYGFAKMTRKRHVHTADRKPSVR